MAENGKLPFHSFSFWIVRSNQPRTQLRLEAVQGEPLYGLSVQSGPTSNPTLRFSRRVTPDHGERLRDALQRIGAFSWEESYGDQRAPGTMKWSMAVVFQEGVFSIESKGGSDVPPRFEELLEELYRLDFPRPNGSKGQEVAQAAAQEAPREASLPDGLGGAMGVDGDMLRTALGSMGGLSAGDLGAYNAVKGAKGDFSYLERLFNQGGRQGLDGTAGASPFADLEGFDPSAIDPADVQEFFSEFQRNPKGLQARLKEEYRSLSPQQQGRMLDALASLGYASRAWWERFFRS